MKIARKLSEKYLKLYMTANYNLRAYDPPPEAIFDF